MQAIVLAEIEAHTTPGLFACQMMRSVKTFFPPDFVRDTVHPLNHDITAVPPYRMKSVSPAVPLTR